MPECSSSVQTEGNDQARAASRQFLENPRLTSASCRAEHPGRDVRCPSSTMGRRSAAPSCGAPITGVRLRQRPPSSSESQGRNASPTETSRANPGLCQQPVDPWRLCNFSVRFPSFRSISGWCRICGWIRLASLGGLRFELGHAETRIRPRLVDFLPNVGGRTQHGPLRLGRR